LIEKIILSTPEDPPFSCSLFYAVGRSCGLAMETVEIRARRKEKVKMGIRKALLIFWVLVVVVGQMGALAAPAFASQNDAPKQQFTPAAPQLQPQQEEEEQQGGEEEPPRDGRPEGSSADDYKIGRASCRERVYVIV
jgi:hypothetical protein